MRWSFFVLCKVGLTCGTSLSLSITTSSPQVSKDLETICYPAEVTAKAPKSAEDYVHRIGRTGSRWARAETGAADTKASTRPRRGFWGGLHAPAGSLSIRFRACAGRFGRQEKSMLGELRSEGNQQSAADCIVFRSSTTQLQQPLDVPALLSGSDHVMAVTVAHLR